MLAFASFLYDEDDEVEEGIETLTTKNYKKSPRHLEEKFRKKQDIWPTILEDEEPERLYLASSADGALTAREKAPRRPPPSCCAACTAS